MEAWLNITLAKQFADRVLPLDADTSITWGQMAAQQKSLGRPMAAMDSLIAATALHHRTVLVTCNVADFAAASLNLYNPWE